MGYLVCIPTAGTGSRLGTLTKHINKSLLNIGKKPAISLIIEKFPAESHFVIALGYQGNLVREFLKLAYPHHHFTFVDVHPFEGPGSGLGFSLLCCRPHLQAPFIFTSCDTLTTTAIPDPNHNWMGFANVDDLSAYRTLDITQDRVIDICEKNKPGKNPKAYIGLAGIANYKEFWQAMGEDSTEPILHGESHGMRALITHGIMAYAFDWYDTGNPTTLLKTRQAFSQANDPHILEKANESIWFVNKTVIKFSTDTDFIKKRVARAAILKDYLPSMIASSEHMYQYKEVNAEILSQAISLPLFTKLLNSAVEFWKTALLNTNEEHIFQEKCFQFYHDKTKERVKLFYQITGRQDTTATINGRPMPLLVDLLDQVDWDYLKRGLPGRFHGDFHFENILYNASTERFTWLDWRQDFGGSLEIGDIYYDLAKLYHGLIVSHELITKNRFCIDWDPKEIRYQLERKPILIDCENAFMVFLQKNNYDQRRVRLLTALIFLNIAALHHHPYNELLYNLGKEMLADTLNTTNA